MKKFQRRDLFIMMLILLSVGMMLDVLFLINNKLSPISIRNIDLIYTALITLGALSATVLTIITSVLNSNSLGYKVKEILNFKNHNLRISELIPIVIAVIIFGTISHQFDLINLTIFSFLSIIYTIIVYGNYIWELSTNENLLREVVLLEINNQLSNTNQSLDLVLNRIFLHYKHSIIENTYDKELMNSILVNISKSKFTPKYYEYITEKLFELFKILITNEGVIVGIETFYPILENIDNNYSEVKIREWLKTIFEQYLYLEISKLHDQKFFEIPRQLRKNEVIRWNLKTYLGYQYFSLISNNTYIPNEHKEKLINNYLELLSNYRRYNNEVTLKVYRHLILSIIKNDIILKISSDNSIHIFAQLCKVLSINAYSLKNELITTLIIIYYLFYFYAKVDREALSQNEMKKVWDLVVVNTDGGTLFPAFVTILRSYRHEISNQIWDLLLIINDYSYLEYFKELQVKSVYWTSESFVEFAFINSIVFSYHPRLEVYRKIKSWEDHIDNNISNIRILFHLFDRETEKLKNSTIDKIDELNTIVYGQKRSLTLDEKSFFEYLNKKIKKQENDIVDEYTENIKLDEFNDFIKEKLRSKKLFIDTFEDSKTRCYEYNINEIVPIGYINQKEYFFDFLLSLLLGRLREHLLSIYPKMKLRYDEKNLSKIINIIVKNSFDSYNFPILDDITLFMNVTENNNFNTLKNMLSKMKYIQEDYLQLNMFFVSSKFGFSIRIHDFVVNDLSEDDLSELVKNYSIGNEKYVILESALKKDDALKYLKDRNKKFDLKFTICEQLGSADLMIFDILFD